METMSAIDFIGAISGIVSLLTVIYLTVAWKTGVDADRNAWKKTCQAYPPGELWVMCKTMWDIYVLDILQKRPDLAVKKSPLRLTPQGKDLIPAGIKTQLGLIPQNSLSTEDISSGWLVVKHIGLNHISGMAKENDLTVQEAVAILSTYLDELLDNSS
jgi:hypothetical protein